MGLFNHFPYTNFHELNLDWIIGKIKEFGAKVEEFQRTIDNIPTGDRIDALRAEVARVEGKADANAEAIAELPDEYPNPESVTFTGAVSATYNGSAPVTVNIPENVVEDNAALTFTGAVSAVYDGSAPVTVNIPTAGAVGGGAVKKYVAKDFGNPESVASSTYAFDTPPADYSPEKCFLAEIEFHATQGLNDVCNRSYWTPSGIGYSIVRHGVWYDSSAGALIYYRRGYSIDLENSTLFLSTGFKTEVGGNRVSGETFCIPSALVLYYMP